MFFLFCISVYFLGISNASAFSSNYTKYISYSDFGRGEPLVLLHAFPTDKNLWLPQHQGLKQYFRVISLDLWGFGYSEGTTGSAVTMEEYADEVAQLLDQLSIKKAIIGGTSMGGYIALAFLAKYPDRVNGLILSNSQAITDSPEMKKSANSLASDVLTDGTQKFANDFINKALSAEAPQQIRLFLQNILLDQTPFGLASALRGMSIRQDFSNVLATTSIPMLIITSDKDTVIPPQQSANMHALAKNSKLVVISDAGHLSNLEQPEQWNKAVIELFGQKAQA
ncbi:alpha/beta hydrolase [Legionella micdadei]|uniref:Alpha/beta hydrolase fold protein n=2 Tax=Legionella micdadei TaxID=451 RepID=A0A098GD34_LEGMI|nr:alpha/beta hydrolase [Legionella micdadei]KTD30220.1 alpha/beta hydrolase [Legionella micdadei]NSL19238.1 alpha/beta hydrolase [Legionella micdadei]CEG60394.1 Alpha/beta hydrolase fold protein [Legionella micdadei]SCY72287.1 Pimeloyl-ACP methyl ester carboxylesterase [Legionella micdadei]